jgi:hypothetical protein
MPHTHAPVLNGSDNEGEFRMEHDAADVVNGAGEDLDARFGLVVPHADREIVRPGKEIRQVATGVVIDAVDTTRVTFQGQIGNGRAQTPKLNGAVQRRRRENVGVLGNKSWKWGEWDRIFEMVYHLTSDQIRTISYMLDTCLGVEHRLHDVVGVALVDLGALPGAVGATRLPVPQPGHHIVATGYNNGEVRVHRD